MANKQQPATSESNPPSPGRMETMTGPQIEAVLR
jgi:hypothetical protein